MWRDLVHGVRSLRRRPAFTIIAALSLALGIAANTLIFGLVDSTLLKPLNFPDPDRLVVLWTVPTNSPEQVGSSNVSRYFAIRDQAKSFESVGAYNGGACGVRTLGFDDGGAPAERVLGQTVSPSLFHVLGVQPTRGRVIVDDENGVDNSASVVLLSHRAWERRFGRDPDVLGRTLVMDRIPVTVIGVMPEAFDLFGDRVEFFAPLCLTRAQVQSSQGALTIVARLKPDVSLEQAQTEMDILVAQLASSDPERHKGTGIRIEPLQRALYADYRSPLLMLQAAVAFVLLIGCANVAGLLLARATRRRSEVALRLAMGARRSRIVLQLLVENVPLAVLGGLLGLVLARGGLALFVLAAPANFPRINGLSLDVRVLAFTLLVALSTAVVFALVPAIQISKASLLEPLKEARRTTDGIHRQRLRNVLATGQMALACVLLIGAGLMIQSFVRILDADLGADPRNVLVFDFRFPQSEALKPVSRYRGVGLWRVNDTPAQTFDRVRERLQSVPGVVDVAAVNAPPFGDQTMRVPFLIEGRTSAGRDALGDGGSSLTSQQMAHYYAVTPGFFRTMKIGLRAGRDFTPYDIASAPLVVIINEAMARQYFPGEDAVGKRVIVDFVPDEQPREIIGVVADTAVGPLKRESAPALYVPHVQQTAMWLGPRWTYRAGMYFVVRGSGNPLRLTGEIKRAVGEVDRNTPVADVRTVEQGISAQLQNLRTYMLLLTIFGAIAVVLAGIGVYGVIANAMAERTREFGIRMAFGARAGDIIGIVARQAAWMVGGGLVIGAFGAMTVTRLLAANVSGVSSADAGTYALGLLLLILVGCVACVIPAWRAARVAPGVALNYE